MTVAQAISRPSRWLSWQRIKRPLAGVILTLGLLASGFPGFYFKHVDALALPNSAAEESSSLTDPAVAGSAGSVVLPENGIYLYGQSPEPNQVGSTYAIFEITDSETVGAFYMPSSSFDCFYGEVETEELDLVVINSYDQAAHAYSMPLGYDAVASESGASTPDLTGYHRIDDLSQQDHQILATCRSDVSQRI